MNRRKFFAFLPLAPVAAIAATEEVKAASKEGAPHSDEYSLALSSSKPREGREMMRVNARGMLYTPTVDDTRKVTMAVGMDGSLWIKNSSDEWKRVVTE